MGQGRSAKRRRLTPPIDDNAVSETIEASDLFHRAADWDLEQAYEQRSRSKRATKEATRLPTKTKEGALKQPQVREASDEEVDSFLGSGSEEDDNDNGLATPPVEAEPVSQIPLKQQILHAKEELARLAGFLTEDPEEHAGSFKKLAQLGGDEASLPVQKLVLASQAAIYKDVIPGYRIRAYRDEDLGSKVSRDVRGTRQYEHALVTGYKYYVQRLGTLAKAKRSGAEA